jgi:MFS family permease
VLFYLMTVFTLSWGTSALGYTRSKFLSMQMVCVLLFAITIPLSARFAERGRRRVMISVTILIAIFGIFFGALFSAGTAGAIATMAVGLGLMGILYAPTGTLLSELFPTSVRYTGSSLAFSISGILGASLAPSIATWLARSYGLRFVGYYLSAAAIISLVGLLAIGETSHTDLDAS